MNKLKGLNKSMTLYVAGLSCLTGAAFTVGVWAGLVAAGVGFIALGWEQS